MKKPYLLFTLIVLALTGFDSRAQEKEILKQISFEQKLNDRIPSDLTFFNEAGQPVKLGSYFTTKPLILTLVYYECPMLCTLSLNGLVRALRVLSLVPGRDYEILTVSFDPKEKAQLAQMKKANYVQKLGKKGAEEGWHFLTGAQASIDELTKAVGFHYTWDNETQQWAHAAGLVILTPQGQISRYLFNVEYSAIDLRLALIEASQGKIGSAIDKVLLYCFHYDPTTGRYGVVIMRALRFLGLLSVVLVAGFIVFMIRREKKKSHG